MHELFDDPSPPADTCPSCDAELVAGDDFCHECGHALAWRDPDAAAGATTPEGADELDLQRCPACPDGWIRTLPNLHRQCESCGYMERV
jgi:hypothetical protein